MPEIGDQLRETRMRNRIDITEVEAATKIRAKYLRALENEEWDLLPGQTFVKTFLRTYADYLGLDARNLVEEYRARYERSAARSRPRSAPASAAAARASNAELRTVDGGPDRRHRARRRALPARQVGRRRGASQATATPAPSCHAGRRRGRPGRAQAPAAARVSALQILPTGPVSVCLENGSGEPADRQT